MVRPTHSTKSCSAAPSHDDVVGFRLLTASVHEPTPAKPASAAIDVTVTVQQTGAIVGGMGRFATASTFTGTVSGRGLAPRDPDGSCSLEQAALVEVDKFSSTGSLSF